MIIACFAPCPACNGSYLWKRPWFCPKLVIKGVSFAETRHFLPQTQSAGGVICISQTFFAPETACRGCHLHKPDIFCPKHSLQVVSFARNRTFLPQTRPAGGVICQKQNIFAPCMPCRGCRLRKSQVFRILLRKSWALGFLGWLKNSSGVLSSRICPPSTKRTRLATSFAKPIS